MSDGCDSPYFTSKLWCDSPIFTFRLGCDSPLFTLKHGCDSPSRTESPDDVLHWKECDSPLKGSSIEICNELIECTVLITPPPPSHRHAPHPPIQLFVAVWCRTTTSFVWWWTSLVRWMLKSRWPNDSGPQMTSTRSWAHTQKWYVVMCEMA